MRVERSSGAGMVGLIVAVFFASGFAALLYQVIWQRLLALFSGADVFSVTIIVSAFMGGLGCGNLAGGHLADRVSRRSCLLLFALAELAIAGFALVSRHFYYDFLYGSLGDWEWPLPAMGALLFLSLLWPTFFMGLSLPLLSRGLTESIDRAARTVGSLYGWNTLGAAAGAVATPWILLRRFDFDTILWMGAAINATCAIAVLLARARSAQFEEEKALAPAVRSATAAHPAGAQLFSFRTWLALYALSGALALSLEIAWFRVLGVIAKSTSFTFGTLLGVYLLGIALGSIVGARTAPRRDVNPGRRFLAIQTFVMLYAVGALAVLIDSLGDGSSRLAAYFRTLDPFPVQEALQRLAVEPFGWIRPDSPGDRAARFFLTLYVGVPLALIGPASFGMGLSFPWLQRALQTDAGWLGRRVGWLQTANIAGSMTGSLVTGFALLPLLGTSGTFRALALAAAVFPLLALATARASNAGRLAPLAGTALLAAVALALPDGRTFWATLHGQSTDVFYVDEDASGVSAIARKLHGSELAVAAGGAEVSTLPFGGYGGIHTLLGAIPVLLHPDPERVAVIGLGSGDTLYAAASRPGLEEVVGIEIIGSQLDLLREFQQARGDDGVAALLAQANVRIHIADGRTFVRRDPRPWDVIEADALRPTAAYAGNLYSREYFEQIRARLAPGGLAVTWLPTRRVTDTLMHVFPYVLVIGQIGIGSDAPIAYDRAALERAAAEPAVREHFARAGIDVVSLLRTHLDHAAVQRFGPDTRRAPSRDLNSDLFARDEFLVPFVAN